MHSKQMFIVHLLDKKQSQNGIATVSGKCQTSNNCYPGIKCVHTLSDSQKYDPDSSLKKASKREMQAMLKIAKSTYLHSQVSRNLQIRFWLKLSMLQIGVFYYR